MTTIVNSNNKAIFEPFNNEEKERIKQNCIKEKLKKHKCNFTGCNASFHRLNRLQRHLNLHFNQRPFKCSIDKCDKAYTNSSHLKRHIQSHSAVANVYKCKYCSSHISTRTNLKRHYKRAHNPEQKMHCDKCNIKFRKKNRYEEHMSIHNNSSSYKCEICQREFISQLKFRRHQVEYHGSKKYNCPIENCTKVFEKWAMMIKHKKLEHKIEYTCPNCNKVFLNKSAFNNHCQTHEKNRPVIPCPYENCHRIYYFKRNLDNHIRTKHIGKKFTCDICGLKLSTKQKVEFHIIQIHNSEKKSLKRKPPEPRKDLGKPKKSMLSKLIGINLLPTTEKRLMKRVPTALLRDKIIEDNHSHSEDDRASDLSAEGA